MRAKERIRALTCVMLALILLWTPLSAQGAVKTVNILKVKNDYVRLRSSGDGSGSVVATLRKGTKLFYLGHSGSMVYVCTEYGKTGYAYAGYLSSYGAVRLASVYYVKSSSLKVYKSASTSSKKLGTLSKNTFVILTDTNGQWGKVRSLSGRRGYVLLSGLRRAGT